MPPEIDNIIDIHTHLGDICGIKNKISISEKHGFIKENFLSEIGYSKLFNSLIAAEAFPKFILTSAVGYATSYANPKNLLLEMKRSKVSKSFILPVEPNMSTKEVVDLCKETKDLVPLCSVDLENLEEYEIKGEIEKKLQTYHCPGIKFHPNLQSTLPTSNKAKILYDIAKKNNIFVIIHVGKTPFLKGPNNRYAMFKNFIGILEELKDVKIIFAHMCKYFDLNIHPFSYLKKYPNIFLDTSGVNSEVIYEGLCSLGPKRLIFGSDWPFNSQRRSIILVQQAVNRYSRNHSCDPVEIAKKILCDNIKQLLY